MRRILYGFLVIIFSISIGFSQNDPAAKKILDQTSTKLKSFKGITANFVYASKSRAGKINSNVSGKISIKGEKYYIIQGKTEIYCDGKKSWNYSGGSEVTVTAVDDNSNTLTPQNLLSNFYDKDFTYKLISSKGTFYEIEMYPTDRRKNFQKVNVFIDKAKSLITKAEVLDKSQNKILFNLSNIKTNVSISDAQFVFNSSKYKKKIEVVEL
jgi:outer membrane lipoprotein carrier protein